MGRVEGKVAIVTGSTRGIGAEVARLLAREGARVVVTGRAAELGDGVAAEITAAGGSAFFRRLDVTVEDDWRAVIDETAERFGPPAILVNNAGVFINKPIERMSVEEWRRIITTNLEGVFLGTRAAIGAMKSDAVRAAGGGSIVNVSSIAGLIGMSFSAAYSASKGGVRLFTKAAALECAELGYQIRINSVHPTFVDTEMADDAMAGYASMSRSGDPEKVRQSLSRMHPLRRFATPTDVASAVLFLASDEASFITGTELVVDGGFTAR